MSAGARWVQWKNSTEERTATGNSTLDDSSTLMMRPRSEQCFCPLLELLRNIASPVKPGEKEYSDLVKKLSKRFPPAPSQIVKQFIIISQPLQGRIQEGVATPCSFAGAREIARKRNAVTR